MAKYKGVPKFPASPSATVGAGKVRHACMGLNQCKGLGRTRDNACAGQGGCGLYGTAEEQNQPVANGCATLGSCELTCAVPG